MPANQSLHIDSQKELYLAERFNSIICGDALAEMAKLPDASFELIVTSPPYNLNNSTGNGGIAVGALNLGRDFVGIEILEEYCELARDRIAKCRRFL